MIKLLRLWLEDIQRDVPVGDALRTKQEGALWPNHDQHAIMELDIVNAYGSYHWPKALRSIFAISTRIAALAAAQYSRMSSVLWQAMENGLWARDCTARGGIQGSRLSQILFAADIERTLNEGLPNDVARVAIADDQYLAAPIADMAQAWPAVVDVLARNGYELAKHKCKYIVPAWDMFEREGNQIADVQSLAESSDPVHLSIAAFMKEVTREKGFLPMLGSSAQGKWETALGSTSRALDATAERVDTAIRDINALKLTMLEGEHDYVVQAAWTIVSKSISHALDYDMRILPWEAIEPHAQRLREGVYGFLEDTLGVQLDATERSRVELPGPLGGLSLSIPMKTKAMGAFLACEEGLRSKVNTFASKLGKPARGKTSDETVAEQARSVLHESGIEIHNGCVQYTPQASERYTSGPWEQDTALRDLFGLHARRAGSAGHVDPTPAREGVRTSSEPRVKLFSQISKGIDSLIATDVHSASDEHVQATMLSAGGPGVGSVWALVPSRQALRIPNSKWIIATRLRLGVMRAPCAGITCHLYGTDSDELCGRVLDARMTHPLLCAVSSACKLKAHNGTVGVIQRYLKKTGAEITVEAPVPELYTRKTCGKVTERFMDLEAKWPASHRYLLDVTIRSPYAQNLVKPNLTPGEATSVGEKDKLQHYGPSVRCLSWEQLGRPGRETTNTLAVLKRSAFDYGYGPSSRAHVLNTRAVRSDVEAHLYGCLASRCLDALGAGRIKSLEQSAVGGWVRHYDSRLQSASVPVRRDSSGISAQATVPPSSSEKCSEGVSYNVTVPPSVDRASNGLATVAPFPSVPVRMDSTGTAAQATVPPSPSEQCSEGVSYNATVPPSAERASNGLATVAPLPSVPVRRDSTGISAQATVPPSARDGQSPVYSPDYG